MLYYYITVLLKKQEVLRIFFQFRQKTHIPAAVFMEKYGISAAQSEKARQLRFGNRRAARSGRITAAPVRRPDMYLRMRRTQGMHLRR